MDKKNEEALVNDFDYSKLDSDTTKMLLEIGQKQNEELKEELNNLFSYKLTKLEKYSQPLTRKEKKEHKKLIEKAKKSEEDMDELVVAILQVRGMNEEQIDECSIDEIAVFGERLLVKPKDLGYIVKKK